MIGGYMGWTLNATQAWLVLVATIALEVAATTCMKLSHGYSNVGYTVGIASCYTLCFAAFPLALTRIELSVAYAVWSGAGTVAVSAIGFAYFRERATALKLVCMLTIAVAVVVLNVADLLSRRHAPPSEKVPLLV